MPNFVGVTPAPDGETSTVKFRKGLEIVCTRVKAVDTENGVVTGKLHQRNMARVEIPHRRDQRNARRQGNDPGRGVAAERKKQGDSEAA